MRENLRGGNRLLVLISIVAIVSILLPGMKVRADAAKQFVYPYRTASSIHALSPGQAVSAGPARLRGVVTQSTDDGMVIQDGTGAVWVYADHSEKFAPGDAVEVKGIVDPGLFSPVLKGLSIRKFGRASLPKPRRVNYRQISTGDMDCQYVSVIGVVRSVGIRERASLFQKLWLRIALTDGTVDATLPAEDAPFAENLIDARVRVDATAMCLKNHNRQITSAILSVSGISKITVLRPPPRDLFAKPLTPLGRLMQYRSGTDYYHRVRVAGVVTYYQPGESLVLEDTGHALLVKTSQVSSIEPGDRVEAVGFPSPQSSGPVLQDALLRRIASGSSPQPLPIKIGDLASGALNYNLVSTEGTLLRSVREPSGQVLLLQNGSSIFLAELNLPGRANPLRGLREGSRVRVSGISMLEVEGSWNYGVNSASSVHSKLVLRSPGDVQLIELPSWWTTRNALYLGAALLGLFVLAFLAHVIYSRVEQWRLRSVLEERERLANEIHDTLAQSFAGIGYQLQAIGKAIPEGIPNLRQQLDVARELVRHSHKEARRSIEPLHAEPHEEVDLLSSLECCAQKMVTDGSVNVITAGGAQARPLSRPIADTFLRIGQEAIANAVRHADPSNISISLHHADNMVRLAIEDDGIGFKKGGDLLGFGLHGMRRRAVAISARLEIDSRPGKGTRVSVTAPVDPGITLRDFPKRISRYLSELTFHAKAKQQPHSHSDCR